LLLCAKNGRERPQQLFGRLEAEKVGSLPPVSVIFSPSLFEADFSIGFSFRRLQRPRVKDLEKTGKGRSEQFPLYLSIQRLDRENVSLKKQESLKSRKEDRTFHSDAGTTRTSQ
jgi:hypothetical protein